MQPSDQKRVLEKQKLITIQLAHAGADGAYGTMVQCSRRSQQLHVAVGV